MARDMSGAPKIRRSCALMPSRKGCLISSISVTKSAASISSGLALRPVRQTCVIFGFSSNRNVNLINVQVIIAQGDVDFIQQNKLNARI